MTIVNRNLQLQARFGCPIQAFIKKAYRPLLDSCSSDFEVIALSVSGKGGTAGLDRKSKNHIGDCHTTCPNGSNGSGGDCDFVTNVTTLNGRY